MVALADVRRWDPAGLEAAFGGFGAARDRLLGLDTDLGTSRPPPGWTGQAADAARAEQDRLAERLRRLTAGVSAVRPGVADAADAVAALRRDLDAADALAAGTGFAIAADGTVTDVRGTAAAGYAAQRALERDRVAAALDGVLRRAAEIDATLARLLAAAATGQVDDGTAATLADAAATGEAAAVRDLPGPPAGASPERNAAWWNGLTPAERDRIVAEHPDRVGNRDGIPAAVRDRANQARLGTETARLDQELADATARWKDSLDKPLSPGTAGRLREQVEHLLARRDALEAVGATLAVGPMRHLLLLDLDGGDRPRAAVAVGDVDTADHVAVFTPGFTSTVAGDIRDYTHDLDQVRDTARHQLMELGRGGEEVATVAWLGYDAPQWSGVLDPDESVAGSAVAREGGRALAGFLDGIDASRERDPHLTALGHSYGSTTTGYALQQAGGVDDAVLFGSPGAGTDTVADLRVPPGHVAVIEARDDAVADLGRFGTDPNQLDGTVDLSARDETGPDGRPLHESVGHSEYLTPGTTSQHNIAATVAGIPDYRITNGNDGLGDVLRWGWDALR